MAYQETGYRWWNSSFRKDRTAREVLRLLVLDTVAVRKAFPQTPEIFRTHPRYGGLMPALVAAADAARAAEGRPPAGKLRYGYGLFQNDLQNILTNEAFWRTPAPGRQAGEIGLWGDIAACASACIKELDNKFAVTGELYKAVKAYNGRGDSAENYMLNVKDFEAAILAANL
ncbi:hypothetical protein IP88_04055 [alpha proteobacterium AAP81b]|nr:hypothetical protein IP88_04055 [alpha proteobacterium AAP81b]